MLPLYCVKLHSFRSVAIILTVALIAVLHIIAFK